MSEAAALATTDRWQKLATTAAAVGLVAGLASMTLFPVANSDTWAHLATGRWIVEHREVPKVDPFSYTAGGHPLYVYAWLSAVWFHFIFQAGGMAWLTATMAIIIAATFATHLDSARRLGASQAVALLLSPLVLYLASTRASERPHIFTLLLAAIYLNLFLRYRQSSGLAWLAPLPVLQVLWVNVHAGHLVGVGLVAVFALGEALAWARHRLIGHSPAPSGPTVLRIAALVPLCLAAELINPYGAGLAMFPLRHTAMKAVMAHNLEWWPIFHEFVSRGTMFALYMALLALLWLGFFRAQMAHEGRLIRHLNLALQTLVTLVFLFLVGLALIGAWQAALIAAALYAQFALLAAFVLVNWRRVDFTLAGILGFVFLLSLQHHRSVADAALVMFPILAGALSRVVNPTAARARSHPAAVLAAAALLVALAAFTWRTGYHHDFRGSVRHLGIGIDPVMPTCLVDFVESSGLGGNAFVSYSLGPLITERLFPRVLVNMDTRNEAYGEKPILAYMAALQDARTMARYLDVWSVDFVALLASDVTAPLVQLLRGARAYSLVYQDDVGSVFAAPTAANQDTIHRFGLEIVGPPGIGGRRRPATETSALALAEAERILQICPTSLLAEGYRARALIALERYDEAVASCRTLARGNPDDAMSRYLLGLAYEGRGDREKAVAAFAEALAQDPALTVARDARIRTLATPGNQP